MIKNIVFRLIRYALVIVVLLFLLWLLAWYYAKPVNDFCNSVSLKSTHEAVISKAKNQGYRVFNNVKNNNEGTIIVETQNMPMFRMGCEITFKDNNLVKKEVINTD